MKKCPQCNILIETRKMGPHISAHIRSRSAKYKYLNGDTHHPYEYKACAECGKNDWMQVRKDCCSYRCSKLGDRNPSKQKASNHGLTKVQYARVHTLVRRERGKAQRCINGCKDRKMYHWANISDDYSNVEDYQEMCASCHDRFDRTEGGE